MIEAEKIAAAIWGELYTATFARSRHEKLWAAMAALNDHEKFNIDNDAEAILTKHVRELRGG